MVDYHNQNNTLAARCIEIFKAVKEVTRFVNFHIKSARRLA